MAPALPILSVSHNGKISLVTREWDDFDIEFGQEPIQLLMSLYTRPGDHDDRSLYISGRAHHAI
jgi:hypothetical protein